MKNIKINYFKVKIKTVAKNFNVCWKTLQRRINKRFDKTEKPDLRRHLSVDEEKIIIQFIKLNALLNKPINIFSFRVFVREFLVAKHEKLLAQEVNEESRQKLMTKVIEMPSRTWTYEFIKRHSEITNRIGKLVSSQRIKAVNRETLDDFYSLLRTVFNETGLTDSREDIDKLRKITFNCDETGICMKTPKISFILPRGDRQACRSYDPGTQQFSTLLACGNAAGDMLTPFLIYRMKCDEVPEKFKSWNKPFYRISPNGIL